MPIIKSAIKRVKQAAKRRERNVSTKRDIKGAVKIFLAKPTSEGLSKAQSEIDTAVKKNLIPKATAARRKSALAKVAKDAGVKIGASKKAAKPAVTAKPAAAKKPVAKAPVKKAVAAKKPVAKKAPVKKPAAKK